MTKPKRRRKSQASASSEYLIRRWNEQFELLYTEMLDLFWNRKIYRAISQMFKTNSKLQKHGGDVWQWVRTIYGRDAVMCIRREMDDQTGAISLINFLHELEEHAGIITREWHRRRCGSLSEFMPQMVDKSFEVIGGPPGPGVADDHIDPRSIARDRKSLKRATKGPVKYANLVLAHRQLPETIVPFKQIDDAIGALYVCFRKYYSLITGVTLITPTPVPQFDWLRPFRFPWITKNFKLPKDRWDL
jgi:hypothetical protein